MRLNISIHTETSEYEIKQVQVAIERVLESTRLLSMATVCSDGLPWIHQAYFAYDSSMTLYVLTQPTTRHSRNLENTNGSVAIAISDSQQTGDGGKRGLQLTGRCLLAADSLLLTGLAQYSQRFPDLSEVLKD